jgi:photosystem II stability/assembly factor-like uncharacterized protein
MLKGVNQRAHRILAARTGLLWLTAGLIFWISVNCNLVLFVPTVTPIPTSLPSEKQIEPTPTVHASSTSDTPRETLAVGDERSSTTPPLPDRSSQPTSTPVNEQVAENLLPTLQVGDPVTITYIHMVSSESGWGIGNTTGEDNHILRTNDGGGTWVDVSPPIVAPETAALIHTEAFFLDNDYAWITYQPYEEVWFTKDGGVTWEEAATGYSGYLGAMFWFVDHDHGWLMIFMDAGMSHVFSALISTTNGGSTWEKVLDPSHDNQLQAFSKTGMVFVDEDTGWVTRDSGGVQPGAFVDITRDGGLTWQSINLPPPEQNPEKFNQEYCRMHSPTLFSEADGALVVDCMSYQGDEMTETAYLFTTKDGGQSWERFDYPGGELHFIDHQTALALGREIYKSEDGGLAWEQIKRVEWDGQFSFVTQDRVWAVARSGDAIALVKTVNGCRTWTLLEPEIGASAD